MQWTVFLRRRPETRWMGTAAWSGIGVSQRFPRCRTVRTLCITKFPVVRRNGRPSARSGTAGKSQPRVWPAFARAEPSRSMAEDDDNFRQEADEEGRYWMDTRTVAIRERETGVCRQKPI